MARTTHRSVPAALVIGLLLAASLPATTAAAAPDRVRVIVGFDARPGAAAERTIRGLGGTVRRSLDLVNALAIEIPRGQLEQLERERGVRRIEIDHPLRAFDHGPNSGDLEYENAWGVEHIGTREVHQAGLTGTGIKLAVIDTGIDYIHNDPDDDPYVVDPEFNSNYRGGYDFYNNDPDPYDDNGHGTHVAGIAAAEKNGYLVVGVAPGVDLYAVKILGATGEGEYSGLIAALQWSIANGMDVVNMSLGAHEPSTLLQEAVIDAWEAGITMVGASGNINPNVWQEIFYGCPVVYPAAYDQVIAVSFTNPNDTLTGWSCTGPQVDFAAPGDQVFSPVPTGSCMFCSPYGYAALTGTSMASPHVAGLVALTLQAGIANAGDPGTLADDVKAHLCAQASPAANMATTDPRYPNWYGCGIVDADRALVDNPPPGSDTNAPPIATDDSAVVLEGGSVTIDVLANDTDADGDALSVTGVGAPSHGSATLNPDDTVTYAPVAGYSGSDEFDYTISDGHGGSASATVLVDVTLVNEPPVAVDDTATVAEDGSVVIDVLANDTDPDADPLSVTAVGAAGQGTATANPDGTITYTPAANYHGPDSFGYSIADGLGGTDDGLVTVTVTPVNDPPVAVDDAASTPYQTAVAIPVLANDSDPEGDALSVQSVGAAANGVVSIGPGGGVTYTPNAGFSGSDSFLYTVSDGNGGTDTGLVTVTVGAAPPPANPIHVGDLDGTATSSGKTWTAKVTIRVETAGHAAVSGAVVGVSWSGDASGSGSCTTGSNGRCTVQTPKLAKASVAVVTFTVTGVTRSGNAYAPAANHDPDGDSDGTSIQVLRPS